jgi:hypothetical protein
MTSTAYVYKKMNTPDFNELSETEKRNFYKCQQCGEKVNNQLELSKPAPQMVLSNQ